MTMLSFDRYKEIYALLDPVGPVPYDCGTLCGSICCSSAAFDGEDPYIYLLPGEKEYLEACGSRMHIVRQRRDEHDLPVSWGQYVYIAYCCGKEMCDRHLRPIQCRTFPLQPGISKNGELGLVLCRADIPYHCPFLDGSLTVSDDFKSAVFMAWQLLIEDEAIRDLVISDSEDS